MSREKLKDTLELVNQIDHLQELGRQTIQTKNTRYAGSGDPFANLRRHGVYGLVVRMDDKIARLTNLLRPGTALTPTGDESVLDTVMDLMNYAAILAAWLTTESGE